MCDRNPLPYWTQGRVTLLGDAAHPMYPMGSNGAGQAILDATSLSGHLARHADPADALQAYQYDRLPATGEVVLRNRKGGPESVIDEVERRAPEGFSRLEDVIDSATLEAIVNSYAHASGSSPEQVTRVDPNNIPQPIRKTHRGDVMGERSGPFWDGVEGRAPIPRAAATLGWEFIDADVEKGTIEVAFKATEDFTNPAGNVLGAFLAAMLYDTVGPALLATLKPGQFQSTLQFSVNFLRPVRPGRIVGKGRVVHRNGDLAYLSATLNGSGKAIIATASATARVIDLDQAPLAP